MSIFYICPYSINKFNSTIIEPFRFFEHPVNRFSAVSSHNHLQSVHCTPFSGGCRNTCLRASEGQRGESGGLWARARCQRSMKNRKGFFLGSNRQREKSEPLEEKPKTSSTFFCQFHLLLWWIIGKENLSEMLNVLSWSDRHFKASEESDDTFQGFFLRRGGTYMCQIATTSRGRCRWVTAQLSLPPGLTEVYGSFSVA